MPHIAFERITAPTESYPLVQDFLNQGFIETSRLLSELEGSPWFKVAIGIEFGGIEPNLENFSNVEDAWNEIIQYSDFSIISSAAGTEDDSGSIAGADSSG